MRVLLSLVAAFACAIVAIVVVQKLTGIGDGLPLTDMRLSAISACELFIQEHLHDPDSAKFDEWTATPHGKQLYTVTVKLRAKNGFGATRRATYQCAMRRTGDQWLIQLI